MPRLTHSSTARSKSKSLLSERRTTHNFCDLPARRSHARRKVKAHNQINTSAHTSAMHTSAQTSAMLFTWHFLAGHVKAEFGYVGLLREPCGPAKSKHRKSLTLHIKRSYAYYLVLYIAKWGGDGPFLGESSERERAIHHLQKFTYKALNNKE